MQQARGGARLIPAAKPLHNLCRHALATASAEWKRAGESGAKLLLQRVAQLMTRAMQPGFYGFGALAEQVGGFLDGHAFDDARDKHTTESIRQFVDRLFENDADFTLRHEPLRIVDGCRAREIDNLGLRSIFAIGFPVDGWPALAQPPESFVHGDARNPGAERRIAAEQIEPGEGARISFLHDVLGLC